MNDSFIIGAYWGSKQETLPEVIEKIRQTLQELGEIDAQFSNWYEGGGSRKKALEKAVTMEDENIKSLCLNMLKKGELNENGVAKNGFLFGLWTGHKDGESSAISFSVGNTFNTDNLNNRCVLTIPHEGEARNRLLRQEKSIAILNILVRIWQPDYAVLTSNSLREKLDVGNEVGWVTYRKNIKQLPKLKDNLIHRADNLGHWFQFNTDNNYTELHADNLLSLKKVI